MKNIKEYIIRKFKDFVALYELRRGIIVEIIPEEEG